MLIIMQGYVTEQGAQRSHILKKALERAGGWHNPGHMNSDLFPETV